ncbi:phosphohydrolase [Haematobacter missouriensis]|uniref:NUDIX domain-containing protein n=1 Tax=Haematobacter missouriensis TaxID=366616 RepID=A0A212ANB5_9RHOB|nr:NUDIX hydrolase [Haematobacter missouriensis]KFI25652.1 phosphohydrolase [Haematobacter missouriensis]OWJ76680.1 NUDIX domain-containing protein [Haematobacter missouriensis]OWJ82987.1 NUDIX domain-containing protein [Haematobacter missouriensis]
MTASIDPARLRPVPAVLSIVLREGKVLLVRRANAPDAGFWGFPGGRIEAGETVFAAAERELMEETSVTGVASATLTVLDALDRGEDGTLRFHYVLVAVACRWVSGEPVADDDALDAMWVAVNDISTLDQVSDDVERLARKAAGDACQS